MVCLGLGGTVALEDILGLSDSNENGGIQAEGMAEHGVEVWVIDSHRPWNLDNVFSNPVITQQGEDGAEVVRRRAGVHEGKILPGYKPGKGGVIVWDDGDLEAELASEKEAYFALQAMPEITEDDLALDDVEEDDMEGDEEEDEVSSAGQKRKRSTSPEGSDDELDSDEEDDRPRRRRRSNSSNSLPIPSSPGGNPLSAQVDIGSTPPPMPSSPPKQRQKSAKQLRKELLQLRRKHEATLDRYYDLGTSSAECVSSMIYSLASELGREDSTLR